MKHSLTFMTFVLIFTVLFGMQSCRKNETAYGAALSLRFQWSASQVSGSDTAEVHVELYLDYNKISVGARSANTLTVGGQNLVFQTEPISSDTKGTVLLASNTVSVRRLEGKTAACTLTAGWRFGGIMDGETVTWLTASDTITLSDENIEIKESHSDETAAPQATETRPETDPVLPPVTETRPETESVTVPETVPSPAPETSVPGPVVDPETPFLNKFEGAFITWVMRSDSGTGLNLYAECAAYEIDVDRYQIEMVLYYVHHSMYVSERTGASVTIGSTVFRFTTPPVYADEIGEKQYTEIYSAKAEVPSDQQFAVGATVPMGVVYSGQNIDSLSFKQFFSFREIM